MRARKKVGLGSFFKGAALALPLVLSCSKGGAQPDTTQSPQAAAPIEPAPAPREIPFYERFTQAHTSLLYLSDPMGVAERYATAPAVRFDPATAKGAQAWWQVSPEQWNQAKAKVERFVPRELAMGITHEGAAALDHFVRTIILWQVCSGAIEAGGKAAREELPRAQQELLVELPQVKIQGIRIWMRARDEALPGKIMKTLREILTNPALAEFADVESTPDAVYATFGFPAGARPIDIANLAVELEMASSAGQPEALSLGRALLGLKLNLSARLEGSGIVFDIGTPAEGQPMGRGNMGQLYGSAPSTPLFGSVWDSRALKTAIRGWVTLLEAWEDTAAGKKMIESDTEDLIGDLRRIGRTVDDFADAGETTVVVGEDRVEVAAIERGGTPAVGLQGQSTLRFVPPGETMYGINGGSDLAKTLEQALTTVEDRIGRESLKEAIKNLAQDEASTRWEGVSERYYAAFSETRALVFGRARDVFEAPAFWALGLNGRNPVKIDGVERIFPNFEYAVGGRVRAGADPETFLNDLVTGSADALLSGVVDGKKKRRRRKKLVRKKDLGLGVPTFVMDMGWVWDLAPPDVRKTTKTRAYKAIAKPYALHYFLVDDHLVISTAPALSRRILDQYRQSAAGIAVAQGNVTAQGRMSVEQLIGFVELARPWLSKAENSKLLTDSVDLMRTIGDLQWTTHQDGDARRSILVVPLLAGTGTR